MKLARITRDFTWLGKDDNSDQPVFAAQAQVCGDRVQVHTIMARRTGAFAEALPLVLDDARAAGVHLLCGYMEPFVISLLRQALRAYGNKMEVDEDVVLFDGKRMHWVAVHL